MPGTFAQMPIAWQLFPFPPLEVVVMLDVVVVGEPVVVGAVVVELVDDAVVDGEEVEVALPGRILMSEQARKFSCILGFSPRPHFPVIGSQPQ